MQSYYLPKHSSLLATTKKRHTPLYLFVLCLYVNVASCVFYGKCYTEAKILLSSLCCRDTQESKWSVPADLKIYAVLAMYTFIVFWLLCCTNGFNGCVCGGGGNDQWKWQKMKKCIVFIKLFIYFFFQWGYTVPCNARLSGWDTHNFFPFSSLLVIVLCHFCFPSSSCFFLLFSLEWWYFLHMFLPLLVCCSGLWAICRWEWVKWLRSETEPRDETCMLC